MRRTIVWATVALLTGGADVSAQVTNEDVARYGAGCYLLTDDGPEGWDYEGWDGDPDELPSMPATLELRLSELDPQPESEQVIQAGFPFREALARTGGGEALPHLGGWRALGGNALVGLPKYTTVILLPLGRGDRVAPFPAYIRHWATVIDGPAPTKRVTMSMVECPA